jgi:hypothetical protein
MIKNAFQKLKKLFLRKTSVPKKVERFQKWNGQERVPKKSGMRS